MRTPSWRNQSRWAKIGERWDTLAAYVPYGGLGLAVSIIAILSFILSLIYYYTVYTVLGLLLVIIAYHPLKGWLARHTTKPSNFARAYLSGLEKLIDYLTSSLIMFSGKRAIPNKAERPKEILFENSFDLEMAGFVPSDKAAYIFAPDIEEWKGTVDADFLCNAFRSVTAFLYLISENAAVHYMKPQNAAQFCSALNYFLAERSAGKFGFSLDIRKTQSTINELLPPFQCETLLNEQCFGKEDGLNRLINSISSLQDCSTCYGFVVGSLKQSFGCATVFLEVTTEIYNSIKRVAVDLHW